MKKTMVELFAGVGGFRLGLESSSKEWKTVFANQWEPSRKNQFAYECYKGHFEDKGGITEYTNQDIETVPTEEIPQATLLIGGFPCQDYSVSTTGAKGIEGKKGVLWWEIERIIRGNKPPFVLLENVDRLLKSPAKQRGRDFGVMLSCLNNLGYNVEWRVINAGEYGFQQRRRRTFIFAYSNDTNYYSEIGSSFKDCNGDISYYEKNLDSFKEAIFEKGFFGSKFPIGKEDISKENSFKIEKDLVKITNEISYDFGNTGLMIQGNVYTLDTKPSEILVDEPKTLRNILVAEAPKKYYINQESIEKWTYLKGAKKVPRVSKSGHEYTFSEGSMSFPDCLDKPGRTMLTTETTINRSSHVIKDPSTNKLRKITPVEAERLNGFPDNWTEGMTDSQRFFCMGNALVVDLIKIMGERLNEIIEKEK